jgi:hypothetical protein
MGFLYALGAVASALHAGDIGLGRGWFWKWLRDISARKRAGYLLQHLCIPIQIATAFFGQASPDLIKLIEGRYLKHS